MCRCARRIILRQYTSSGRLFDADLQRGRGLVPVGERETANRRKHALILDQNATYVSALFFRQTIAIMSHRLIEPRVHFLYLFGCEIGALALLVRRIRRAVFPRDSTRLRCGRERNANRALAKATS